jgi:hypothetical protein
MRDPAELMMVAERNADWTEQKHSHNDASFRHRLSVALICFDEHLIAWDDIRRVIQGWRMARFRMRMY